MLVSSNISSGQREKYIKAMVHAGQTAPDNLDALSEPAVLGAPSSLEANLKKVIQEMESQLNLKRESCLQLEVSAKDLEEQLSRAKKAITDGMKTQPRQHMEEIEAQIDAVERESLRVEASNAAKKSLLSEKEALLAALYQRKQAGESSQG